MANRIEIELAGKDSTGPAFDSATKKAAVFKGALADLEKPLGGLVRQGEQLKAGLASLGVLWAANTVVNWHKEIQKTIGSMADQADAVGLTTDQLQAYHAAARRTGTELESMQQILGRGNVVIGQAAAGEEAAANAFKELRVQILDSSGKTRDHNAILAETAKALLGIEDVTKRAALSQTIFSKAGSQMTPVLREMAQGMAVLDYNAKAAGQTVSNETIEIFRKLNDQSDETAIRIRNMYAELAAPIQFTAMQTLNGILSNVAENASKAKFGITDLLAIAANPGLAVGKIFALAGPTEQQKVDDALSAKRSQVASLVETAAMARTDRDRARMTKAIAIAQGELDTLAAQSAKLEAATSKGAGQGGVQDNVPDILPLRTGRFAPPKSASGGSEKRDRIGEEIAKLSAEARAAEAGLRILSSARPGTVLADLERAAELEKKIGEIIASAGKYKPSDERIAMLRAEATHAETARQAFERKKQILELADATEAKYGDGQRQLRDTQLRLTEAVDSRRLSQEAMNAAMIEATRTAQDQTLKLQGLQGGLTGFTAGLQYAVAQEERQNSVFNLGVQAWQQGGQIFKSVTNDIANGAEINFGRIALSFVDMLSQMAFAAAQAQLGSALFGGKGGDGGLLGGLFSGLFSGLAGGGAEAGLGLAGGLFTGIAFAEGGRPPVGVPSIVGDGGEPEWFIPDQPGTIVPFSKMGRGGGGGDSVVIHQTMTFGADVSRPELETRLARHKQETIAAVYDARGRGGAARTVMKK
jgi:FKBP-type peptidyl-prolyl cis-trans isomerase 2